MTRPRHSHSTARRPLHFFRSAMLRRPLLIVALLSLSTGCHFVSSPQGTVPASRLPEGLFDCPRESLALLPMAALGQSKPLDHPIAAGDTLSVYVYGIFPASEDETPVIQQTQTLAQRYYPPRGTVVGPSTGLPIRVDQDGTVNLPLVEPVRIAGLTTSQAVERISAAYRAEQLIKPDAERITVSLLVPRVHRVVVMREDTPNETVALVDPQAVDEIHRGSGETIDLPTYENDVLHALAETGGLPGTDAAREVYVIRSDPNLDYRYMSAGSLQSVVSGGRAGDCNVNVIRIPLVGCPCEALPFRPQDVICTRATWSLCPAAMSTSSPAVCCRAAGCRCPAIKTSTSSKRSRWRPDHPAARWDCPAKSSPAGIRAMFAKRPTSKSFAGCLRAGNWRSASTWTER